MDDAHEYSWSVHVYVYVCVRDNESRPAMTLESSSGRLWLEVQEEEYDG